MRQVVKTLLDERDNYVRALATNYNKETLIARLETLSKSPGGHRYHKGGYLPRTIKTWAGAGQNATIQLSK
jgi:hypothetical protein